MIKFYVLLSVFAALASLLADIYMRGEILWFSRSGALLVLTGALLEYQKLLKLWSSAKHVEQSLESVASRIKRGTGVGLKETAEESVQTRDFAIRIYDVLTKKDKTEVCAVIMVVLGTLVWAYGDIPFVLGWI